MKHSELTNEILSSNGITGENEKTFFKELRATLRLDYVFKLIIRERAADNSRYTLFSLPQSNAHSVYLQNVMLHALVQCFNLSFVMKNKKNFPNALILV